MSAVIAAEALSKYFGRHPAVVDLDLDIPPGVVFGYLGPNGAGKTTTIRMLVGLSRPSSGRVLIGGADTVRDRAAARRRIGYLPGQFVAYPDLTAHEYLGYLAHLRGGVDHKTVTRLAERLDLDTGGRIGAMSHGNRQKVGLVQAFMAEPEVIVLDEPTTGLDPLVQREFQAIVREVRERGATVFLSSHVLSEVQAVADSVGILRQGRLVEVRAVTALTARALHRLRFEFARIPPDTAVLRALDGVRTVRAEGRTVHVEIEGSTAELLKVVAPHDVVDITGHEPDLEDVFLTYYGGSEPCCGPST